MGMLMFLYGFQGIYYGGTDLPIGAYILKAEKKKKKILSFHWAFL